MAAPPVLRDIFAEYRAQRGNEDDGYVFEDSDAPISRIDVLVYRGELTSFATIGMATNRMPGEPGRTELLFRRRGTLGKDDEKAVAVHLANLAIHPFRAGTSLNWGQIISYPDDFPTFPGCPSVFLSGPLSDDEPGYVQTSEGPVRILNVVPLTGAERDSAKQLPAREFAQSLLDPFAPRPPA